MTDYIMTMGLPQGERLNILEAAYSNLFKTGTVTEVVSEGVKVKFGETVLDKVIQASSLGNSEIVVGSFVLVIDYQSMLFALGPISKELTFPGLISAKYFSEENGKINSAMLAAKAAKDQAELYKAQAFSLRNAAEAMTNTIEALKEQSEALKVEIEAIKSGVVTSAGLTPEKQL